jgi:hypothetical protein
MPEPGAGAGRIRGTGRVFLRGETWWIAYRRNGREYRRSTGYRTAERAQAEAKLDRIVARGMNGTQPWLLTAAEIRLLRGPIVYVLARGTRTLYVGQSRHGLVRPLSSRHHILAQLVLDGRESLAIYPCDSPSTATALEVELIQRLQPRLNVVGLTRADDA